MSTLYRVQYTSRYITKADAHKLFVSTKQGNIPKQEYVNFVHSREQFSVLQISLASGTELDTPTSGLCG
jgi:hypothetical protein